MPRVAKSWMGVPAPNAKARVKAGDITTVGKGDLCDDLDVSFYFVDTLVK